MKRVFIVLIILLLTGCSTMLKSPKLTYIYVVEKIVYKNLPVPIEDTDFRLIFHEGDKFIIGNKVFRIGQTHNVRPDSDDRYRIVYLPKRESFSIIDTFERSVIYDILDNGDRIITYSGYSFWVRPLTQEEHQMILQEMERTQSKRK